MKLPRIILFASALIFSSAAFSYGTGYSSYPLMINKKLISTEFTGITSNGGGIGLQARYTQKVASIVTVDAGIGIGSGERSTRAFVGSDLELFPDYQKQPRISLRGNFEFAKEFGNTRSVLSLAPTVSKGFSFWGEEAFPYISLPVGLSLNSKDETYMSTISANIGITGNLPIKDYRHITATAEMILGLKDSFTGVFLGASFPLN